MQVLFTSFLVFVSVHLSNIWLLIIVCLNAGRNIYLFIEFVVQTILVAKVAMMYCIIHHQIDIPDINVIPAYLQNRGISSKYIMLTICKSFLK